MKPDLETRMRSVEDELAIRALAARFTDCCNERDFDGFADLWSARAVWEIGPPLPAKAQGVDAIVDMLRRMLTPQKMFIQMTHSGVVTIAGDRATARFVERERGKGGHGKGEDRSGAPTFYENLAVYNDELIREADGKWRFSHRIYVYRYLDTSAFTGRVFPLTGGIAGTDVHASEPGASS